MPLGVSAETSRISEARDSIVSSAGTGSASSNNPQEAIPPGAGNQSRPVNSRFGLAFLDASQQKRSDVTWTLSFGARGTLEEELVAQNELPLFMGEVEHAYTKAAVGEIGVCPRCKSATEKNAPTSSMPQNVASRVMLAPAGYFCSRCPTVIVDESILATSMRPGLQFRGSWASISGGEKKIVCLAPSMDASVLYPGRGKRNLGHQHHSWANGLSNPSPHRVSSAQKKETKTSTRQTGPPAHRHHSPPEERRSGAKRLGAFGLTL